MNTGHNHRYVDHKNEVYASNNWSKEFTSNGHFQKKKKKKGNSNFTENKKVLKQLKLLF